MSGSGDVSPLPPCNACPLSEVGTCRALRDILMDRRRSGPGAVPKSYHQARAKRIVLSARETAHDVYVLCAGWASQFVRLADGRRQIVGLLAPGDVFADSAVFGIVIGHAIQALTDVAYTRLDARALRQRVSEEPELLAVFARACLKDKQEREALVVDLGRRSAEERIAHLVLRIIARLASLSVIRDERYPWPLRQQDVADATGLTPVHVSRTLAELRKAGIIDIARSTLTVIDREKLESIGRLR
jgi:CRP-like cAMP-binding protein